MLPERRLALASIVVLTFPELEVVESSEGAAPLDFPYIPGLLSFREMPAILAAWARLTVRPDVLITSSSTSDFGKKEIAVYKKVCGKIVTLPPQAATSTTARVRALTISGADELAKEIIERV